MDAEELTPHQRAIIALHFDATDGAPYWQRWSREHGVRADQLATRGDLRALPPMDRRRMEETPFRDFLPRAVREGGGRLILGETGGATGAPLTVAWTEEDFEKAFVAPLRNVLERRCIALRQWLFAGPTGPHIIGKAADRLAQETTGCDALKIDMDPRWHRRLAPGTPAALRHLAHLREQTEHHLRRERPDALFITPSLLRALLEESGALQGSELRLVHLGGQSITPGEREKLRRALPPDCALINGYGNSLFGCLVEEDEALTYKAPDERLIVELVAGMPGECGPAAPGDWGTVTFHRFDASMLILNARERDEAQCVAGGIYWPRPAATASPVAAGVY
jgi:phenylacetate-coenzyme A ligase PaaK-like adenylate-forming protein